MVQKTTISPPEIAVTGSTTAGLTTKVVKGSVWMIAGQVAPLAVTFCATYFVLRLIEADLYGVLVLIALIPSYFSYADLGMSMASTKFASEALAEGSLEREAKIIRTAAAIAMAAAIPVALAMFVLAEPVLGLFKVAAEYLPEAKTALRIASVTFLVNFLCSIVNTPQLTRLRMDLNTYINAGTRVAGLIATPIVLYLGFGIVGVASALLITNLICLALHLAVSNRLLRGRLSELTFDREMLRPLLRFGGGYVAAAVAGVLLMNGEKAILTNSTSPETLAFYWISFTLASMLTMFSASIVQSLMPAFSQLQATEKKEHLNSLFSVGVRLNLIWLAPVIGFLFLVAEPFLKLWAGVRYSAEGTIPFFVLLAGVAFNILAYLPYSSIMAAGRTDVLAKLFWIELVPHLILTVVLTQRFGIVGAALAWSVRAIVDSACQFWLARRVANAGLDVKEIGPKALLAAAIFAPTVIMALAAPEQKFVAAILFVLGLGVHLAFCWRMMFSGVERDWIEARLRSRFGFATG